jgi:hypothetical protein
VTEEQVFLAVLDLPDDAARAAYLDRACGEDAEFRRQVEALLAAHFQSGEFLDVPAAEQVQAGSTNDHTITIAGAAVSAENDHADESDDLNFLTPSTRPDSLGRLGHYEMLQVLGKGGFGIVFRAFDDMLQRVVAVKVMAPQLAATSPARRRFLREARLSAQVRHEHVVQVYEVGEQPLPYLAMEFIPGETLQQKLDRTGPLDVPEVLRIGRQIAEGLAAAHACDLIHRDIKPGNVLLEGGSHKAKITDFGLARAADDASISQSGVVAGTPMFMAPEQTLGHKIDQRADLFSLGSVLYQMVSGRPPFRAPSTLAVLKRVAEEQPRPIQEIIPETPAWLCALITKLHAKKPEDRFQSAREVADLLADCEAKLRAKQAVKNVLPADPKPAKRKWVAAAALLLLPVIALAVTEFAGVTQLFQGQAPTDPVKPGSDPAPVAVEKIVPPVPAPKTEPLPPADAPFTDADVQRIAALPAAEQVEEVRKELMRLNPGFDGQVGHKIEDGVIVGLQIVTDKVTNIAPIRAFTALRMLDCSGTITNGTPNGQLADLPLEGMNLAGLTRLNLTNTRVSDAGLAHFRDCKKLISLHLPGTQVSDSGLANFKDCNDLISLSLPGTKVTDAGLAHFKDCKDLTELNLAGTQVSDGGLAHLKDCKNLTLLRLSGTRVSEAGLENFKGTPLKKLFIAGTDVTDLKPLQGMALEDIRLTPRNIIQGLDILRDMKSLKTIGIEYGEKGWPAAEFWERYDKGEFK